MTKITRVPRAVAAFGTSNEDLRERDALRRRVRLVNILCLVCGMIGTVSLPFDARTAPDWMIVEDLLSAVVFFAIPFLNRGGRYRASRVAFLLFGNALFLWNAMKMGTAPGIHLIFFPIAGFGALLFEGKEWASLAASIVVPMAAYFFCFTFGPRYFPAPAPSPNDPVYFLYSSLANFVLICSGIFFLQRTSDQAAADLKRSQAALVLSEKMAALGEMSGGVAHEINTPLAAIRLNTELLRRHLQSSTDRSREIETGLATIDRVAQRISKITQALQSFSRSAEQDPPVIASLETIVKDAVELCAERFRNGDVRLIVDPVPADATIECRPVQISQVILNLLNNAFSAIANRSERWVQLRVTSEGPRVRITVTDSGDGVSTEIQDKIFQPFFTTKGPGHGTGLGLSISKGIVEDHSGRIFLAKESAHTRFVVELPRRA
ncbi:MAG: GHKL domain-containing protein [Bdellovibrionales bacterium]|nr:GHKL domain-containing protein [Bdellovibrionales bacterium]